MNVNSIRNVGGMWLELGTVTSSRTTIRITITTTTGTTTFDNGWRKEWIRLRLNCLSYVRLTESKTENFQVSKKGASHGVSRTMGESSSYFAIGKRADEPLYTIEISLFSDLLHVELQMSEFDSENQSLISAVDSGGTYLEYMISLSTRRRIARIHNLETL